MSESVYLAERIFTGEVFMEQHGILVKNGIVAAVIPVAKIPQTVPCKDLGKTTLAPAYTDLQINGAGGLMFSASPSVEALKELYKYSLKGGATHFMATLPTNSAAVMQKAITAVLDYQKMGLPGLLGLHLEGPYLNPVKKGAHIEAYIQTPTLESVTKLTEEGQGCIRIMTIAPERCPDEVIQYLTDKGIILSAGHSNATYQQAMHAFSLGVEMCTHLYNAMSPFSHKDAGLVGAAFDSAVYTGIIPDGIHVNPTAVRTAFRLMKNRLFFVTDAITATQSDSYHYLFKGDRYETANGTLAGSCLTMQTAVQKAIRMGIDPAEALKSASLIPAKAIGREKELGRIAKGYPLNWVVLDRDYTVIDTIT